MEHTIARAAPALTAACLLAASFGLWAQTPTHRLNDSGLTLCGDASSNSVACTQSGTAGTGTTHPRQDAEFGRSAADDVGGVLAAKAGGSSTLAKGFDFSRMQNNGTINQSATTPGTAATSWGCTQDNVTALVWLVKQTTATATSAAERYRLDINRYRWYSTLAGNGGESGSTGVNATTTAPGATLQTCYGSTGERCDTGSLIATVNAKGICGETANDWRLPTRAELMGISTAANQGGMDPSSSVAYDSEYFPNMARATYWTADNVAGSPKDARVVNAGMGSDGLSAKSSYQYVMLVRGGAPVGDDTPANANNCTIRSGNLETTPFVTAAGIGGFTDHGDGTVTHNKTGLMWKRCIQGRSWSAGACGGSTQTFNWQNALKSATTEGTGIYSDWRLPSRNEFLSIIETGCSTPMINPTVFPNIPGAGQFWTSTHAGTIAPTSAWAVRVDNGSALLKAKTQTAYVLLVREGATTEDEYWRYAPATPDQDPNPFALVDQTGVSRSTLIASAPITISGINTLTPISVSGGGGEYRIDGGAWTSAAGNIANGQQVEVRHTSSSSFSTTVNTTLTVGSRSDTFSTTTVAIDTTPDAFSFVDQTGVARTTTITSDPITVTGINSGAGITVSGGSYSINSTTNFVTGPGTVNAGDLVRARHTSSGSYLTSVNTTVTIGGVQDVFTSQTMADPALNTDPNPFSFTSQSTVDLSSLRTSNAVTISGITAASPISVANGEYCIGSVATTCASGSPSWTSSAGGTITNGQSVQVRHTASASDLTPTVTTLTIGTVNGTFTSTTGDSSPSDFSFPSQSPVLLGATITSASATITGIDIAAPISVTNGTYSIGCGVTYVGTPGTITSGQTVCVRHTSSASETTPTTTTLTVGGISAPQSRNFVSTTGDRTPDAMTNQSVTGVALSTAVRSAPFTITGTTIASPISVSGVAGSQYCIGNDALCAVGGANYTATAGTVSPGATVYVRHTSSGTNLATTTSTLTVGGVPVDFAAQTVSACSLATWQATTYSNTSGSRANFTHPNVVTLTGLCADTPISFVAGNTARFRYSLNGGGQTGAAIDQRCPNGSSTTP